jgi:hypothetical protein
MALENVVISKERYDRLVKQAGIHDEEPKTTDPSKDKKDDHNKNSLEVEDNKKNVHQQQSIASPEQSEVPEKPEKKEHTVLEDVESDRTRDDIVDLPGIPETRIDELATLAVQPKRRKKQLSDSVRQKTKMSDHDTIKHVGQGRRKRKIAGKWIKWSNN